MLLVLLLPSSSGSSSSLSSSSFPFSITSSPCSFLFLKHVHSFPCKHGVLESYTWSGHSSGRSVSLSGSWIQKTLLQKARSLGMGPRPRCGGGFHQSWNKNGHLFALQLNKRLHQMLALLISLPSASASFPHRPPAPSPFHLSHQPFAASTAPLEFHVHPRTLACVMSLSLPPSGGCGCRNSCVLSITHASEAHEVIFPEALNII